MSDSTENVALFSGTNYQNYQTDDNSTARNRLVSSSDEYDATEDYVPPTDPGSDGDDGGEHNGGNTGGDPEQPKPASGGKPLPEEPYAIPPFDQVLSNVHESAMQVVGFGRLQWLLYTALGFGLMGDGIELLMIAYVLPGAEKDFCMTAPMKGWLGAIAFAGMVFGAAIWGNLADKIGRKPTLITSLAVNALFTIVGAFMPSYWLFLLCRFLAGLGIGGSIPIVMAYGAEFSPQQHRGLRLGLLMSFWVVGGVYVSALGWIIIPSEELSFKLGADTYFHSWRLFILICGIPVIVSIIGLIMMPESPRFLLQVGRDLEALAIYRQVYVWNHKEAGAMYEMPEIELPGRDAVTSEDSGRSSTLQKPKSATVSLKCQAFFESFYQLFYNPLSLITLLLMVLWFSVSFGYYGMSIWFPEYMKRLQMEQYFAETNETDNAVVTNTVFTQLLDNTFYSNSTFTDVNFTNIQLRHIRFDMCLFRQCNFINVTAKQTSFSNSILNNTLFNRTDFYPSKFKNTVLNNCTFTGVKEGCDVDFEISYSQKQVFLETLVSQIAVVPVTILSALLMDRVGRVRLLAGCLFLSGVSVFFIWVINSEVAVVCLNAVFNCLIAGAFNSMDVASTELYPTHLRATAFGFLSCLGRIAAILGNVSFGNLIDVSKAIPILITAAVLSTGGILAVKLPESTSKTM